MDERINGERTKVKYPHLWTEMTRHRLTRWEPHGAARWSETLPGYG